MQESKERELVESQLPNNEDKFIEPVDEVIEVVKIFGIKWTNPMTGWVMKQGE